MYEVNSFSVDIDTSLGNHLEYNDAVLSIPPMPPENFRVKVMELQNNMLDMGLGDTDEIAPVTHHFAPGNYAREIFLPKGMVIIGKIHKHAHVNVISKGRVHVVTEDGTIQMEAPCTFISEPGTKRCVYAIEDTVWTTIHPTEETDLEKIEKQVIAPSYDELLKIGGDV